MKLVSRMALLISLFSVPVFGQDGIVTSNAEYYAPLARQYSPFLAGRRIALHGSPTVTGPVEQTDCHSCCTPLLPTVAQGIRNTFQALFPCYGTRRTGGQGLLFSARFYESSCCGSTIHGGNVLIETDQQPTPAKPTPTPEEVTPEIIDGSVQFRRLPATGRPATSSTVPGTIRPVSGDASLTNRARTTTPTNGGYPPNPLRQ